MRRLIVSLVVLAALGVVAAQALAAVHRVRVGDNFYVRPGRHHHTITVRRGTRIRFRFVGSNPHDVHAIRGPVHFRSPVMTSGTFSRKLRRRGTYVIHCDLHPRKMRLTIHVH
jgi:plastocyanin